MGRIYGTRNKMRTPEEKEQIVLEYLNSNVGYRVIARNYDVHPSIFSVWIKKYRENGIEGLKSRTGKNLNNNSKYKRKKLDEVSKLQKELLKKEIELMRLKKGYLVKGVGAKKEYVFIQDVNMQ